MGAVAGPPPLGRDPPPCYTLDRRFGERVICHPVNTERPPRGCGVDPVHIARVRVYQEKRPNRRAFLGDFPDPVRYGVNSGVKAFYKIEPEEELPSTLDHLVSAAAG
jgi:hypothetical protein